MIKILENTNTRNGRYKNETVTKMGHYFTTCQHNTEEPASIEISTPISLEVWLLWCQTDMVFLDSK